LTRKEQKRKRAKAQKRKRAKEQKSKSLFGHPVSTFISGHRPFPASLVSKYSQSSGTPIPSESPFQYKR
jgi:hypothetical protein